MSKNLKRIDEQFNRIHEIKEYGRKVVRKMQYELKPITEQECKDLKDSFPDYLKTLPFKKFIPNASVEEDDIIYECPERPTVLYNIKSGTIKVSKGDFEKYEKEGCSNQGCFTVRRIKECSDILIIDYLEIHFFPRKPREAEKNV